MTWPWRRQTGDEAKSRAYLIYSEWGPDRRIPRAERLASVLPGQMDAERTAWMAEFDAVDREIWAIAETGLPRTGTRSEFIKRMAAAFPFMNDEALGRAWSLAVYYTVHEGY